MDNNLKDACKILIVEDHDSLRESICNWLTDLFPDIVAYQASTGERAIEVATDIKPDIILMDIGLPGINGIEAMKEIHSRDIPAKVVVLTILDGEGYREKALKSGAVEFIPKSEMNTELPSILFRLMNPKTSLS